MDLIEKELSCFIKSASIPVDAKSAEECNKELCIEYPPSDADRIADKCSFIGEFKKTGLTGNEPAWYSALQVVRCCEDGYEKCHEFSSADSDYKEHLTDQKLHYLEQKNIAPTLCSTAEQFGFCKDCKLKGKIKSPIQAGLKVTPIDDSLHDLKEDRSKARANEMIKLVPKGDWHVGKQGIYRIVDDNPELVAAIPFYIVDKICENYDDETVLTIVIRYYLRDKAFNFKFPLKHLGENRKLLSEFSARSVFPANINHLKAYIITYVNNIANIEPYKVVNSMGWQNDDSFIFTSKGEGVDVDANPTSCIFDQKMIGYTKGFYTKGSIEEWRGIIQTFSSDKVFNPYMFSILCSMGAPLLTFTAAKGVLLSLHGASGSGKTLAHKAALSVWGDPETVGVLGTKDTHTALLGRMGAIKNLPLRLDEATTFKSKQLTGLVYEIVNGRGRSRATIDGSLSNTAAEWQTITLVTTNRPLLESNIATISEAERNRILEIEVDMPMNMSQVGRKIGSIFKENFGLLSEPLINCYVKHKDKVLELIEQYQNKFQSLVEDDKRFWVSCGAVAFTAGILAKSIKLIDFDHKAMIEWFEELLKTQTNINEAMLEENRGFKEPEEFIAALLDWLSGSILKLNTNLDVIEEPNKEIKARLVRNNDSPNILYVRAPILKEFVQKYYVCGFNSVRNKMNIGNSAPKRFKDGQVRCYQFVVAEEI